jgi:UDP-N-acetylglucosamine--N-acetylmuramyl-(pentapeptide) pyrophosphoryl-undecaprenol N-acetylglucosamine transferase
LGRDILKKEGFSVEEIAGQGLPRTFSWRMLTFPFQFLQGWREAGSLLRKFRPDWVLGMGGYLSVPVILTARMMGVRTLLHEQNVFPGLSNRFLSRWADSVAVSFPGSEAYFKRKNVWVSGLPIRPEMGQTDQTTGRRSFGLDMQTSTVLVFGGSLGAQRLNTIVTHAWPLLQKKGISFQVIHVTGTKDFERVEPLYRGLGFAAKVLPYCHKMDEAYAASDAVVCRSGASTVAELMVVKRPALLVPYPHASNNHQLYNARVLEQKGGGKMILDKDLTPEAVANFLIAALVKNEVRSASGGSGRDSAAQLASFLVSKS